MLKKFKNRLLASILDWFVVALAWILAYVLRYNFMSIPHDVLITGIKALGIVFIVQVFLYHVFHMHRGVWRFTSIVDLIKIIKVVLVGAISSVLVLFLLNLLFGIPRAIFPIYFILLICAWGGMRIFYRYLHEHDSIMALSDRKKVLIIGAGSAGDIIARDILRNKQYKIQAFIDDDHKMLERSLHGIPVVGNIDNISMFVTKFDIDLIIIAIPSATAATMQRIVAICRATNVPFQTLPGLNDITNGHVAVSQLREVSLEDLLGRDQVQVDYAKIGAELSGHVILVTGGGGSIGSELCRQIASFSPAKLIIIDHSEFNLYSVEMELAKTYPDVSVVPYLVSVTDENFMSDIFAQHQPDLVFHAAAYKHVPLLEHQQEVAIKNNVLGTYTVASLAKQNKVAKFILVSSDKAVNPSNIMGATKRLAELICHNLNRDSATDFMTVRFGNVLGSVGSVVPLFKKQLADGGPLTITHPDITRYFMTIQEAVSLVLQTSVLGAGGDMFVLNMGEPVKIHTLAEQIIKLSGKEPGLDVAIVNTGLRPGEKLFEELFYEFEERCETAHEKIWKMQCKHLHDAQNALAKLMVTFKMEQYRNYTNIMEFISN
jgi:FlaA1/EpsC-like NDP-sugar epimerase